MIPAPAGIAENDFARLGPKWVGEAMNAVSFPELEGRPTAVGVPWWRVINAQGGISMPANSPAAAEQRARLEAEGLVFDANDHLDLARVGWAGPAPDWLASRGLLPPKVLRKPPTTPQQMALF
jgi:alkylated DNA nucleotide flippase Atl1